jgi:hypothetical protein
MPSPFVCLSVCCVVNMQQISPFCFQLPKLLFVFILTGCETDQTVLRQNETVFLFP